MPKYSRRFIDIYTRISKKEDLNTNDRFVKKVLAKYNSDIQRGFVPSFLRKEADKTNEPQNEDTEREPFDNDYTPDTDNNLNMDKIEVAKNEGAPNEFIKNMAKNELAESKQLNNEADNSFDNDPDSNTSDSIDLEDLGDASESILNLALSSRGLSELSDKEAEKLKKHTNRLIINRAPVVVTKNADIINVIKDVFMILASRSKEIEAINNKNMSEQIAKKEGPKPQEVIPEKIIPSSSIVWDLKTLREWQNK